MFNKWGVKIQELYNVLKTRTSEVEIMLTEKQKNSFNDYFSRNHKEIISVLGDDIDATIKRLGLDTFRISMVLTLIRYIDKTDEITDKVYCSNLDFSTALSLVGVLQKHAVRVFNQMPVPQGSTKNRLDFFNLLPDDEFDRQKGNEVGEQIGITKHSVDKYLKYFRNHAYLNYTHNKYKKVKTKGRPKV